MLLGIALLLAVIVLAALASAANRWIQHKIDTGPLAQMENRDDAL